MSMLSWLRNKLGGRASDSSALKTHFEHVLSREKENSLKKMSDPYWSSGNTNVGADELAAIDLAGELLRDPECFSSPARLERELLSLRSKYINMYDDFDGFGAATYYDLIRAVREFAGVSTDLSDLTKPAAQPAVADTDYSQDIDDALYSVRFHLAREEFLMACDFAQIHLVALGFHIASAHTTLSDSEVLILSHRLREARSLMLHILIEGRLPRLVYRHTYRHITAASALLAFLQTRPKQVDSRTEIPGKIPIVIYALDIEKANRFLREQSKNTSGLVTQFTEDLPHCLGLQLANRLQERLTPPIAQFLDAMFTDTIVALSNTQWRKALLLHYMRASTPITQATISFSPLEFEPNDKLVCFAVSGEDLTDRSSISIGLLGDYDEIVKMAIETCHGARHAAVWGAKNGGEDLKANLRRLSLSLLAPFHESVSESGDIVVIAEGVLSLVPFSGLFTPNRIGLGEEYLVEGHRVVHATSHRALSKPLETMEINFDDGVLFCNPAFNLVSPGATAEGEKSLDFQPLPGSESECLRLAEKFGWMLFSGSDATAERLLRALASSGIVHIATHGEHEGRISERNLSEAWHSPSFVIRMFDEAMSNAFIACAGANQSGQGRVSCADLASMDLRHVQLLYLSLCFGASGDAFSGEASFSLARTFVANGASCVIAAALPVSDTAAQEVAILFYDNLRRTSDFAGSLQRAQLGLARKTQNWSHWAAFQLWI